MKTSLQQIDSQIQQLVTEFNKQKIVIEFEKNKKLLEKKRSDYLDSLIHSSVEEYFDRYLKSRIKDIYSRYGEVFIVLQTPGHRYESLVSACKEKHGCSFTPDLNEYFWPENKRGLNSFDFDYGKVVISRENSALPNSEEMKKKTLIVRYLAQDIPLYRFIRESEKLKMYTLFLCPCNKERLDDYHYVVEKNIQIVNTSCGGEKEMIKLAEFLKELNLE